MQVYSGAMRRREIAAQNNKAQRRAGLLQAKSHRIDSAAPKKADGGMSLGSVLVRLGDLLLMN
jgi:hypothetical protein